MRSLRTRMALAAGRGAGWASRVTGRGAGHQISGTVMLRVQPDLLRELAADQRVVLVSATNGKTTTTHLLTRAIESTGRRVVSNVTGANLASGLASALERASGAGVAVLEVDERVLPGVLDDLHPELLVLGNLSRDQLDRYGEVGSVTDAWRRALQGPSPPAVVANASDPPVAWAAEPAAPTWVDLGTRWRQDAATCPRCGAVLAWGDDGYACPSCAFAQPAAALTLAGDALVAGARRVPLELGLPGAWNAANAALAVAAAGHFGVDAFDAARAMRALTTVSGRYTTFALADGRPAQILLAKNPAGWHEILRWLGPRDSGVVIALNAHVADGRDPSWLWDVPFEALAGHSVAAAGERALDVALRLDQAGVDVAVDDDPLAAAATVTGDEVHIVASYTQFTALGRRLRRGRTPRSRRPRTPTPAGLAENPLRAAAPARDSAVRIGLVYPELLGTYGDRGNAITLADRLRRRGHAAEIVDVAAGAPVPDSLDIYLLGGGEDDSQVAAARGLRASAGALARAHARGAVVLAVCAGFQLVGHRYEAHGGEVMDGLGLVDVTTAAGPARAIGEVVVEPAQRLGLPMLSGFENHGGRSSLGAGVEALGAVVVGTGNGDGADGAVAERLVGTYLHGPVLPRNPALADLLLGWVVGDLTALDDALPEALRHERLDAALRRGLRRWWQERRLARA